MTSLTRVLINPQRRAGRQMLSDPQKLHAAVRAAFPPDMAEDKGRVLWRVDHRGNEHVLYIVGPEQSTADHIVEQAGWDTRPPQVADYDRFLSKLMVGQKWAFELVANPTYSESRGKGKRGKVKAHVSVQHQLEWLRKRAEKAGFKLNGDEQVIERTGLDFYRNYADRSKRNRVHIVTARFRGVLEVTDVEALQETLRNGIGRARGYGCGLLTLAPVEE